MRESKYRLPPRSVEMNTMDRETDRQHKSVTIASVPRHKITQDTTSRQGNEASVAAAVRAQEMIHSTKEQALLLARIG